MIFSSPSKRDSDWQLPFSLAYLYIYIIAIHELPEEDETDSLDDVPLTAASHKPAEAAAAKGKR